MGRAELLGLRDACDMRIPDFVDTFVLDRWSAGKRVKEVQFLGTFGHKSCATGSSKRGNKSLKVCKTQCQIQPLEKGSTIPLTANTCLHETLSHFLSLSPIPMACLLLK